MPGLGCKPNFDRRFVRALSLAVALLALSPSWAAAQTNETGITPLANAEQVIQRNTDPFAGSLPQGKPTGEMLDLTIDQALDMGLKYNLGLYLSDRATEQARAARLKTLSDLLPNVSGSVSEQIQRINLKAFGFKFAGFPSSVGPFGLFE